MSSPTSGTPADPIALRAEHDALADRLGARRSVDEIRSAAYTGFAAFLSFALACKFAWDRWGWSKLPKPPPRGRYPLLVAGAGILFSVLLVITVRTARRAAACRRDEERLYARFAELRKILGLDA